MTIHTAIAREATRRERIARLLLSRWPLLSGCGLVASGSLARAAVPNEAVDVWADIGGAPCVVSLDDLMGRSMLLVGDVDRKISWVLNRVVFPGDIAIDAGANLGLVSIQMAQRGARVLAFEPSPAVLPKLRATLAANPSLRIELFEAGLGEEEATLTLSVPDGNTGRGSFVSNGGQSFAVPVRRLSDVLKKSGIGRVDVMKMDVEGFEAAVLRGLFSDPAAPRPEVVVLEVNTADRSALDALKAEGYRLFGIPKRSLFSVRLTPEGSDGFAACHDYVAVSRYASPARMSKVGGWG